MQNLTLLVFPISVIARSSGAVIELTKSLRNTPVDIEGWVRRATELLRLGYPDLAAGDAYKAKFIVQQLLQGLSDKRTELPMDRSRKPFVPETEWHMDVYQRLIAALQMTGDHKGLLKICNEGKGRYQGRGEAVFGSVSFFDEILEAEAARINLAKSTIEIDQVSRQETMSYIECGYIRHLPYPFVPKKILRRGTDLFESTQTLFRNASSTCMLAHSPIAYSSSIPHDSSSNVLGVFATRNIHFAERLVEDTTILAACTVSTTAPATLKSTPNSSRICENCYGSIPTQSRQHVSSKCCNTPYCSARCRDMALDSYHKVLCGQNFDWVYEESRGKQWRFVLNGPMWLRILAACVQSNCHPLDHPSIARLTPLHDKSGRIWTLSNNISTPIRILNQLGINPIEDFRYDTWVLQTIWTRVINNQEEHTTPDGRQVRAISPLYSFFNHSCEPNTGWSPTDSCTCTNGSTKDIFANRHIRKGEELCITYGVVAGHKSKAEGQKAIQPWIGSDKECGCTKCQRGDSDERKVELQPVGPHVSMFQGVRIYRI